MTARKIAISLPEDVYVAVKQRVDVGEAESVSGFISQVLHEAVIEDPTERWVADFIAEFGEPTDAEKAWAEEAIRRAQAMAIDPTVRFPDLRL